MDTARLVLDYIDVLIWPSVVAVALWIFRDRLNDLIKRIVKGKVGPAEFEFEQVRELADEIEAKTSAEAHGEIIADAEVNPPSATSSAQATVPTVEAARKAYKRLVVREISDVLDAWEFLADYDRVEVNLEKLSSEARHAASMFILGVQMGSRADRRIRIETPVPDEFDHLTWFSEEISPDK